MAGSNDVVILGMPHADREISGKPERHDGSADWARWWCGKRCGGRIWTEAGGRVHHGQRVCRRGWDKTRRGRRRCSEDLPPR